MANRVPDSITQANMAKVAEADSLSRVHLNFTGIHQHGNDPAKHAHQDLPKKRRMQQKRAQTLQARIASQKKQQRERQARIEHSLGIKEVDTVTAESK